ncbi:MAG: glycoside hydrolase family 13 protein [Dermatophilaceae bacterium]
MTHPPGWWRDAVVYQIYPRSFADSDGDGEGDLPGITAKLEHLRDLGVDALWLSPCYPSPQVDGGYDVADYRGVDPRFGTLADLDALVARATDLGLAVLLDLVPNHCSDRHPWFQAALRAGPGSPERALFHFRDGRGRDGVQPPNNWRSVFGGSAWTRITDPDGRAGQWYLHLFDRSQPDWNWDHRRVGEEFESVLRFWLDRGIAGFRVDVAPGLVKRSGLPDDPHEGRAHLAAAARADPAAGPADPADVGPMWDQDGVHDVYAAWRRVLDEYADPERVFVAEAWLPSPDRTARYVRTGEMHLSFAFGFLDSAWTAPALRSSIDAALATMSAVGAPCAWVLSNHDVVRTASRLGLPQDRLRPHGIRASDPQPDEALGLRRARAAAMVLLALPGAAFLYQGEELGLPDHTALPDDSREDPVWRRSGGRETGRDGCRVPLPWAADAPGFGFGPSSRTWLPQPPDYARYAVDRERRTPGSTLQLYRTLLALRRRRGLGRGTLTWGDRIEDPGVLEMRIEGADAVRVVVNFGPDPVALPADAQVLVASDALTDDGQVPTDVAVWAAG